MTGQDVLGFVLWVIFGAIFWIAYASIRRHYRVGKVVRAVRRHQSIADEAGRKLGHAPNVDEQMYGLVTALDDRVDQLAKTLQAHNHRMTLDPADAQIVRNAVGMQAEVADHDRRLSQMEIVERWSESE